MSQNFIKIENSKASIIISNLKCTEDEWPNHPKMHISFDVAFESQEYKFNVNFSEMLYDQFNFKQGTNQIVDECFQEKRLIIKKDEICLQIQPDTTDALTNIQLQFVLKVDSDKIEDFKIELNAYVDYILKN